MVSIRPDFFYQLISNPPTVIFNKEEKKIKNLISKIIFLFYQQTLNYLFDFVEK